MLLSRSRIFPCPGNGLRIAHPVAGTVALTTVVGFWLSTVLSELLASQAVVAEIKMAIPWGFLVLVPALAMTGGTGFALSGGRPQGLLAVKVKRMPFIVANGLLALIPSALFLAAKAKVGELDAPFYAVQALELLAGALNIMLLGLNMRDGFKLKRRRMP